ncbi:phage tail protein [Pseudomonas sp. A46]|jgi:phage tail protein X|nr:tail protein X [Pseudomonas sp. A46]OWJ92740.1 phage tail protein [Pseudomonas sp. A46]
MDIAIAHQGETLDALCWRIYGRTAGITEAVLQANPGLAEQGPVLHQGTAVRLPPQPPEPERTPIRLWD